mmetsp:Transcript_9583/g.17272  ORF Transcript_9583/g.17272 Transcript_9583/m.17272 type:complete len:399 (-) Transcript_9583:697-1893(-)
MSIVSYTMNYKLALFYTHIPSIIQKIRPSKPFLFYQNRSIFHSQRRFSSRRKLKVILQSTLKYWTNPSTPISTPELIIVDTSFEIFRAYHALKDAFKSRESRGLSTHIALPAIYGFLHSIKRILTHLATDTKFHPIVFTFEGDSTKVPSHRTLLYSDYKATRKQAPEGVTEAFPIVKRLCTALGFRVVQMDGFEADDVIGMLSRMAIECGANATIVSPDKDFLQLLEPNRVRIVKVSKTKNQAYDYLYAEEFSESYGGLKPAQFADILALIGDVSDNVPGVKGIGEKTAVKLIQQYGNIEKLLNDLENLKGMKLREKIQENREVLEMSKKLVLISDNLPLDECNVSWKSVQRSEIDVDLVMEILNEVRIGTKVTTEFTDFLKSTRRNENLKNDKIVGL